jgi:hypothetical protein
MSSSAPACKEPSKQFNTSVWAGDKKTEGTVISRGVWRHPDQEQSVKTIGQGWPLRAKKLPQRRNSKDTQETIQVQHL